jgi:hypothetical protein
MVEVKIMSLDEFLHLTPGTHPAVGGLEFTLNNVLGCNWEESHHLRDSKGELRALLTCHDKHARLVFLNYINKPPVAVVFFDGRRKVILSDANLRAEVRMTGSEIELAVTNDWECRDLEVYVARDKDQSLSLLPSREGFKVVRLE